MTQDNLATRLTPEIGGHVVDVYGHSFGKITAVYPESDEIVIRTNKGGLLTISSVSIYYNGGGEYTLTDDIDLEDVVTPEVQSALNIQIGGSHYKDCVIQPVEYIVANKIGFLEGCVIKRATRHNKPTGKGRQDIEKAIHELQLILELRYPENN